MKKNNNLKQTKILILMAACNGAKYISNQIESILGQNKVEVTIKIGVDISNDNTLSICKNFERNFKNI